MSGLTIPPDEWNLQRIAHRRQSAVRASIDQTEGVNPDTFAEATRLAPALGSKPELLLSDMEGARSKVLRMETSGDSFAKRFPLLAEKLKDVRFLSMTRDDLGNLKTTEGTWDWIGQSWGTARDTSRTGTIGLKALAEGRGLTPLEAREYRLARERAAANAERDSGYLGAALNLAGSMLDSIATAVAAGAVSGPAAPVTVPLALFGQSFRLEGGNLYAELVEEGHTPAQAREIALTYGTAISLLEAVGTGVASKGFRATAGNLLPKAFARSATAQTRRAAFTEAARNYVAGLVVEPTTETAQEVVGMLGKDRLAQPGQESFDWAQAGAAFSETFKGMVVLGGLGAGGQFATDMRKAADATHTARVMEQLAQVEAESKLGDPKRSPDDRAAFVQQVSEKRAQAPEVFIDGQEFGNVLRQADAAEGRTTGRMTAIESLEKLLPGITEKVRVAEETGADVVVPTGDFIAKLGRTEIGPALFQHARFDPEGMTPAEGAKILAERETLAQAARKQLQTVQAESQAFAESAKAVESAVYEQITATGRLVDPKQRRAAAVFWREFVATQAARRGMLPEEFAAQFPLQVQRGEGQEGAGFSQRDLDTPEFRNWFGDSKVVDAEGKPQVYYHATGADFSEFRRARLRGASFFSATPESAFTGASASANEGMAPIPNRTIPVYLSIKNLYGRSYVLPKGIPDVRGLYPADAGQRAVEQVHAAIADAVFSRDAATNRLAKEIAVEEWGKFHHSRRLPSGEWELYRTDKPSEVAGDSVREIPESRAAMWWQTFERGPGGRQDAPGVGAKALESLGYDGALISDEGVSTVAVFDGRRIKSVNNRGTFDPADPNILRDADKGRFIPEKMAMLLYEKADASSFIHESAHAFLSIYGDLAAQGDAQATADLQVLLDDWGVKDVATWNAMSLEQQRKYHERFARQFEGYVFDGKAPSEALRPLFDRFKAWLRNVYQQIRDAIGAAHKRDTGEELPILTGEVRQVMDRMLASDAAIAEAEAVRNMAPLFQTQEQSGMSPEEWAAYQEMAREATAEGVADLERASLRQMEWLSNARSKMLREKQAEHDAIRKQTRREVALEVAAQRDIRADRWLRTGRMVNEDGTTAQGDKDTNHKLDAEAVAVYGFDEARMAPYVRGEGGLNPDMVAEQFGYTSGEAMLRELAGMRTMGEQIDARTDERMLAEHSELSDPAEVEAAVERALHNEARARFLAVELRHLQGATQPVRLLRAAAKEAARQAIATMPVRQVTAKAFAATEARAARMVTEALKAGKSEEAAEWQRKRLLQHMLATVAGEFEAARDKELRNLQRFRKPDADLAKKRDTDLVNAARWILSRYNLGTPGQASNATRALQAVAKYDTTAAAQIAPILAAAEEQAKDYRDLTVEQFQDLMAKVDGLWNDSRRTQQIRIDGKLREKAEARELIVAQLQKAASKRRKPVSGLGRSIGGIEASLRHVESWALEMDGGQPGPVHEMLFRILRDRYDDYLLQRKDMSERLQNGIKGLPKLYGRKYEAKFLRDAAGVPHVWKDRAQILGWVLHLGNLDNARKDAVGRGWVVKDSEGNVDLSPVLRELQSLIDAGHVTKADMQWAQAEVWDTFENVLKPEAQKTHKDVYGYHFTEVGASPLTLRFPDGSTETFRGGYAPAKADPDLVAPQPGQVSADGITESGADFASRHPSAPKGFTIERTGIERPLMHDLRMVPQSFAEELQFIHMQRAGKDLAGLLNDRAIAEAIRAVDPDAIDKMFQPWLSDTMRDRLMAPGGDAWVNRQLVRLRRNVGMAYMFGNVANAFQQLTGLATAATYVPMKHLRAGLRNMARAGEVDRMKAASKFMRLRIDKRLGQITDDIDSALKTNWAGKASEWTRRNAYVFQRVMQMPVDIITWMGAHDQAMSQGKTDAQAVAWADAAVRRSQGSGTAADISRFERSSAPIRLLTQFGGFWLAQFNTLAQRHGKERATAAANVILFAGVTAGAISQALKGGWDDDDEDGELWDDVTAWTFGESVRTATSLVPVVGPIAYRLASGEQGGRVSPAASLQALEQAARGFDLFVAMADPERDVEGKNIRATGLLAATMSAFPWFTLAARPVSYATDVASGEVQPTGAVDYARGLVTGVAAPGTRQ